MIASSNASNKFSDISAFIYILVNAVSKKLFTRLVNKKFMALICSYLLLIIFALSPEYSINPKINNGPIGNEINHQNKIKAKPCRFFFLLTLFCIIHSIDNYIQLNLF